MDAYYSKFLVVLRLSGILNFSTKSCNSHTSYGNYRTLLLIYGEQLERMQSQGVSVIK